jgi:hypothetical protein
MKTFVYHENASGKGSFTKTGDAWIIDEDLKIFVVADSTLRCLIRDTKEYPFDDHGYEAAELFCKSFLKYGEEFLNGSKQNNKTFREVLMKTNKNFIELNKKLGKEYDDEANYDIAETVGIGAVIKDKKLYYGGLEDCYINVLRGDKLGEQTIWKHQILKAGKYLDTLSREGKLKNYIPKELVGKLKKENEWEPTWCNYLRNNPDVVNDRGENVGWGCFTGESEAEEFIQSYSIELKDGDHILLFSDGMIPVLENTDFLNWFLEKRSSSFYFQLVL